MVHSLRNSVCADVQFPSGKWLGFYNYGLESRRCLMDLHINFSHGNLRGSGTDDIGFFTIHGEYDSKSREAIWIKEYPGRHSVYYHGFRENRGIWGTWEIVNLTESFDITSNGGFHIWPDGTEKRFEASQKTLAGSK